MNRYFFDSSALIKYYIEEEGSDKVVNLILNATSIYISKLSIVECISVLRRAYKENRISKESYDYTKSRMITELSGMYLLDVDDSIISNVIEILDSFQMKTLDAIQLASVYFCESKVDFFVLSDNKLLKNAERIGIRTINPLHAD